MITIASSTIILFLSPFFSGMMSEAEHSVHNEWFDWVTKRQQPQLDLISKSLLVVTGL